MLEALEQNNIFEALEQNIMFDSQQITGLMMHDCHVTADDRGPTAGRGLHPGQA